MVASFSEEVFFCLWALASFSKTLEDGVVVVDSFGRGSGNDGPALGGKLGAALPEDEDASIAFSCFRLSDSCPVDFLFSTAALAYRSHITTLVTHT